VIVFELWCNEKKVLKTSKEPLYFFQKLIQAIFEKKQYYFHQPHSLNIWSRDHFGLSCNEKKVLDFFLIPLKGFFDDLNFFAKNKYCNTVKIFEKNAQTSIIQIVDHFVNFHSYMIEGPKLRLKAIAPRMAQKTIRELN
jgi:hypothetical protein